MSRYSYDDMPPEGYRERRGGERSSTFVIAFIGVITTLIAIVAYLLFVPQTESEETAYHSIVPETEASLPSPNILPLEMAETAVIEEESAAEHAAEGVEAMEAEASSAIAEDEAGQLYSVYIVKEEDTVESVTAATGISARTIVNVNGITDISSIKPGNELLIPPAEGQLYTVRHGDNPNSIAARFNPDMTGSELLLLNRSEHFELGQSIFIPSRVIPSERKSAFVSPVIDGEVIFCNGEYSPRGSVDGVVIAGSAGSDVLASADGVVQSISSDDNGRFVILSHTGSNGYVTEYHALETVNAELSGRVKQGAVIGTLGTENMPYGQPAVLFTIKQNGISIDPERFVDFAEGSN